MPHAPGGQVNVVVSGWQTYDNKGRVVEKYEPFFACGWEYRQPTNEQSGQKATMYYDPRGHMVRTVNPNRSQRRVIYGIPTIWLTQLNMHPRPGRATPTTRTTTPGALTTTKLWPTRATGTRRPARWSTPWDEQSRR